MSLFGSLRDAAEGIAWVLYLIPQFAFGYGLMNIAYMVSYEFLDNTTYTPLSMRITGNSLVYMAVSGAVYFFALLALER